jgi:alkylation response protein AidB-like acyl-CoA dehydrogenase
MSLDLRLTEEQELLRATMRDICDRFSDPSEVRALEDDPVGYRPALWKTLAELGMHAPVGGDAQGDGLTAIEVALTYEEFGRALCPTPHLVSSVLASGLIQRAGTEAQQQRWSASLASGKAVLTCAWVEPRSSQDESGVQLTAAPHGHGVVLSGVKTLVPFAAASDAMLTLARTDRGVTLYIVERDAPGMSLLQVPTLAADCSYQVTYDDVTLPAEARLGPEGSGWDLWEEVMTDVLIAVASYAVGGAARAHEMATDYAKGRVQFDKPIGSFQGVAHPLAEMAMEVEGARVLAYEAAWARARGRDARTLAAMAKLYACDVFRRTTKVAHQVYGGIGFTRDIDIQLYYRRAKQLELSWWGPAELEERIAAAELDAVEPFVTVAGGRQVTA